MSSVQNLLTIAGDRAIGAPVRSQNVTAAIAIANIVKSSFGPVGLDKMLVDDIGDVIITNDGATILKMLEVDHPAAKVLVELAQLQDEEIGDGTTSVVLLAAEFLKNADELVKQRIHPTTVINGYRLACKEACRYIQENLTIPQDELNNENIKNIIKTTLASKLIGSECDLFADMILNAMNAIKVTNAKGKVIYPIKTINILKSHGKSVRESLLIPGYALNCVIASQAMPKKILNAKIGCFDFSFQKTKMKLGVQFVIDDPEKIKDIHAREYDITKERVQKILATGCNVILCTGGIDDSSLKYFVEKNVMAVRRCKKEDLLRIAKITGAQFLTSLSNFEGDEVFDNSMFGEAAEVSQERVSDDELIFIKGPKARTSASLIIRGPNSFFCDEVERSIHDALCAVKRVLESRNVVVGGGCVETALSIYLENFATTLSSREQLAIAEFAKSLLVIPKVLAVNAAKDASDLVTKLRALQNSSQTQADSVHLKWFGLDLAKGELRDNKVAGVLEPTVLKVKALRFATEAAITILRIDDMIKLYPEKKERPGRNMH